MHNITGQHCLIIGGGKVALRRAKSIVDAGGVIDVVSKECSSELMELVTQCDGRIILAAYQDSYLSDKYILVVAATNDSIVNQSVSADCKQRNLLVNVVDNAENCDVIFPAVVERDPIQIAISSGSQSPQFTQLLKDRINTLIPSEYGKVSELFGRYRNRVKSTILNASDRKKFWNTVLHNFVTETALSGNVEKAERQLDAAIDNHHQLEKHGEVYLIGAGPGDPDLLTLRAFRLLQQAEVVLYDRLVSDQILQRIEDDKELVYVGKERAKHTLPQDEINDLLIHYAKMGKKVARLKGGDPFIFGRGGEEIEDLASQNIPFQVIPGITAASGCASYAGIPLTHRDHAQSVRFVTGQLQDGTVDLNWPDLISPNQTLVFYMGLRGLPIICEKLIAHGAASNTPAALIEKGTTLTQRIHVSTLSGLPALIEQADVGAPTLIIVGSVVTLHAKLSWFKRE